MLLANGVESITSGQVDTSVRSRRSRRVCYLRGHLRLLGNGERLQFLQVEYLHKTLLSS
jgi:hypothetical protein